MTTTPFERAQAKIQAAESDACTLRAAAEVLTYLTRDEIAELLCLSTPETGTPLSQSAVIHYVHEGLRSAPVLEPIETWGENYTEKEADARREWAWEQAHKFYEATR